VRTILGRSLIVAHAVGCGRIGYTALDEDARLADGVVVDGATNFDTQVGMDDGAPLLDTAPSPSDAQDADAGYDAGADACPSCTPSNVILSGQDPTAQWGGTTAGTPYSDLCPENQVLLGFQGSVSKNPSISWMHSVQGQCGTISVVGQQIITTATVWLPERGQNGGVAWSSLCPPNQMVMGVDGRSSGYVDQLAIRCALLTVTGAPGAYGIAMGAATELPPVGSNAGTPFPTTDCPAGEVARGANIRADNYPRAFGLICGTPSIQVP
jgi:hypothetical protein